MVDSTELAVLEQKESNLLPLAWKLWYFFAFQPRLPAARAVTQIPARITSAQRQLERRSSAAIADLVIEEVSAVVLGGDYQWNGSNALWIQLNLAKVSMLYEHFEKTVLALRDVLKGIESQELEYFLIDENLEYIVIVPVVCDRMISESIWVLHTASTIMSKDALEDQVSSLLPREIPAEDREALGLSLWNVDDVLLANQFSAAVAGLSLLAAQVSEFMNLPDLPDAGPGIELLMQHMEEQSHELSQLLQAFIDTGTRMLDKFNNLSEEERLNRPELTAAVAGLNQIYKAILPSEDFSGEQLLTIDRLVPYAQRLMEALPAAEQIKLHWIADSISQEQDNNT